jgi:hypothetical protein
MQNLGLQNAENGPCGIRIRVCGVFRGCAELGLRNAVECEIPQLRCAELVAEDT